MEQECGVELDIRLQVAARFVLFEQSEGDRFEGARQLVQLHVAAAQKHPLGGDVENISAGVAHPINPVAEAHQLLAPFELVAQIRFGARRLADFEDHVERGAGRAAVQRPLERTDCAGDGGDEVGAGRDDHAGGEGRRIQAVIDDGVEIGLEPAHALGGRRLACEHVEIICGVAQIGARRDGVALVQ